MPSEALYNWRGTRMQTLKELEDAHRAVSGKGPGRRVATEQINRAYIGATSAQFQAFCRDLHNEAAIFLSEKVQPPELGVVVFTSFQVGRQLDKGNVQPASLGADFSRFQMEFWTEVEKLDDRNNARKIRLEQLNIWRNSIAHADELTADEATKIKGTKVTLQWGRRWRDACNALAGYFDRAVADHVEKLVHVRPW